LQMHNLEYAFGEVRSCAPFRGVYTDMYIICSS